MVRSINVILFLVWISLKFKPGKWDYAKDKGGKNCERRGVKGRLGRRLEDERAKDRIDQKSKCEHE